MELEKSEYDTCQTIRLKAHNLYLDINEIVLKFGGQRTQTFFIVCVCKTVRLADQVACVLCALPDKCSVIKVRPPAASVHISGDAMALQRTRERC